MVPAQHLTALFSINTPVFITTEGGQMIYKNHLAELMFPKPRINANIVPFLLHPKNMLCSLSHHDIHSKPIVRFAFDEFETQALLATYVKNGVVYCVWVFSCFFNLFKSGESTKLRRFESAIDSLLEDHFSSYEPVPIQKSGNLRTTSDFLNLYAIKFISGFTEENNAGNSGFKSIKKILGNIKQLTVGVFTKSDFDFNIKLNFPDGNAVHIGTYDTLTVALAKLSEMYFEKKSKQTTLDVDITRDILHFVFYEGENLSDTEFERLVQVKNTHQMFPKHCLELAILEDVCRQQKWKIEFALTQCKKIVIRLRVGGAEDRRYRARMQLRSGI